MIVIAGYVLWPPRGTRRVMQCAIFTVAMTAMLTPWMVRNYRYTGALLPTSTHGGIQLWYGTLQTGQFLESRAHNPRSIFASAAFDYTSIEEPIIVSTRVACAPDGAPVRLFYRTDRESQLKPIEARGEKDGRLEFAIPGQQAPTAIYYYFDISGATTPSTGDRAPFVYFVTTDHLGDQDRHHDVFDIFDIGRLMRLLAWQEPLPAGVSLDLSQDGVTDRADLTMAVTRLLPQSANVTIEFSSDASAATLRLSDGSSLTMPRQFEGRQTDFGVDGNLAGALLSRHVTMASLRPNPPQVCPFVEDVRVNDVFYRREPNDMRRYTALAFDNISRDPLAFAAASAYRMVRLFIIRGTDDQMTTHQFPLSRFIFDAGLMASLAYFAAFLAGVIIAWRARTPFLYALIPIVYVPLTICFVLTNMRYTITVQPLMFVFVAMTAAAVLKIGGPERDPSRT